MNHSRKRLLLPDTLEAIFISQPTNVHYLSKFQGLAAANERNAFIVATRSKLHLISFPLYQQELQTVTEHSPEFTIHTIDQAHRLTDILQSIFASLKNSKIGFEDSATYREYRLLQSVAAGNQLVEVPQYIEQLRATKDATELESIKKACAITDACFSAVLSWLQEGISEYDLAWEIEAYIRTHGADIAFPPIVAFNKHSAIPHHLPLPDATLKTNSAILLDFGAKVQGYCADITRSIWFGTLPDPLWLRAYQTVLHAKKEAEAYLQSTAVVDGSQADTVARNILTQYGYETYPHSLGHGVGLDIHESPRLSLSRTDRISAQMVFTVEPAIYIPGSFGIRLEDTVVKTETTLQHLTGSDYLL